MGITDHMIIETIVGEHVHIYRGSAHQILLQMAKDVANEESLITWDNVGQSIQAVRNYIHERKIQMYLNPIQGESQ